VARRKGCLHCDRISKTVYLMYLMSMLLVFRRFERICTLRRQGIALVFLPLSSLDSPQLPLLFVAGQCLVAATTPL
jgi:hypothetical protein